MNTMWEKMMKEIRVDLGADGNFLYRIFSEIWIGFASGLSFVFAWVYFANNNCFKKRPSEYMLAGFIPVSVFILTMLAAIIFGVVVFKAWIFIVIPLVNLITYLVGIYFRVIEEENNQEDQ